MRLTRTGTQTSVQDLGRAGYACSGVPRSGAFDAVSLRVGNRLVGNDEGDAGIEMTLRGAWFRFERAAVVCLAGAGSESCIVGADRRRTIERWRPEVINAGEELRVGAMRGGARSYLCISGGVLSPVVLGSRSTLVSGALGQRVLRDGDGVEVGAFPAGLQVAPAGADIVRALGTINARRTLRVTPGTHHARYSPSQLRSLTEHAFTVSPQSDRGGVRCLGSRLAADDASGIVSEAVVPGCVQVPPSGELIVLGVDGPTTGGYPVVACVIGVDLPALGQCAPGDEIRFEWVEREQAVTLLREQQRLIGSVATARISGMHKGAPDGT